MGSLLQFSPGCSTAPGILFATQVFARNTGAFFLNGQAFRGLECCDRLGAAAGFGCGTRTGFSSAAATAASGWSSQPCSLA